MNSKLEVPRAPYAQVRAFARAALEPERESRAMFVTRLENMQENGDKWLTVESVLALLNDCDMLAQRPNANTKPLSRQDEIQEALAKHGLRMEHSLAVFDGGGHAIMSIATGEQVDEESLSAEVVALAEEWTVLESPLVVEEAEAVAGRIASRMLPPAPDRLIFEVWHDGDSSVGLPGDRSTVEIDLRGYAQVDRREYIEQVRGSLKASFGAIWGSPTKVMTSAEIRAEEAWLEKNDRSSIQLMDEALSWPPTGPGEAIWEDWLRRARAVCDTGPAHHIIVDLVKHERSEGLSTGQWEGFLRSAMLLRSATGGATPESEARNLTEAEVSAMSGDQIQRGNWAAVLGTLLEAKKHLQKDGVRHSWLDGSIGIAKQGAQLRDTDLETKHAQTVGERQDLKNQEANSLALQAVSLALADAHAKLSNPNAISSNIDEVRWAEAMQSLESLSGKDSGEYYDSVATKRPYLIQKCTQEVERGIVKTLGYRAILNLSYSNGDLSTTAVFGCKPDALNHLEAAVASANDHVVDIQMGYPATPELLTSMSLIKAIQDRGLALPLSRFEVPGVQAETLPVIWRTWLNQDHQQHCDIELHA